MINSNVEEIIVAAPEYQAKLITLFDVYAEKYSIDATLLREQVVAKINWKLLKNQLYNKRIVSNRIVLLLTYCHFLFLNDTQRLSASG